MSPRDLWRAMKTSLHRDCEECDGVTMLLNLFEASERKLTEDELRSILSIAAVHLDMIDGLAGVAVRGSEKKCLLRNWL
jgi:hypothetical protein